MKIYHYTSIETLALILKNRTIRFSKLTKVDDPEEYSFICNGINPAHYVFVSCWTRNESESIPQWVMYGNKKHGVRIALDEDMFDFKREGMWLRWFTSEELKNKSYEIMPILNHKMLYDVAYVENPQSYFNNIFVDIDGYSGINFEESGIYKRQDWEFQKECRFIFKAFPKDIDGQLFNPSIILNNNIPVDVDFIDVPIKQDAFENMEVMFGPEVSEAESTIVEALCQKYLGNNRVRKSIFY